MLAVYNQISYLIEDHSALNIDCTSSLHYKFLSAKSQEILLLGYSVLLSDVDIITLKNPFHHLYRDEDVEGLSDGFDNPTAYGIASANSLIQQACH